jgi:hypothetical protein
MDANITTEAEDQGSLLQDDEEEKTEELDPASKKAEYAKLYQIALQNAHPEWTNKERLDWQHAVIGKRNRAHWSTVDYVRAVSELGGGKKERIGEEDAREV